MGEEDIRGKIHGDGVDGASCPSKPLTTPALLSRGERREKTEKQQIKRVLFLVLFPSLPPGERG